MSERSERLAQALRERLGAVHVEVVDESHLHAGHAGAEGGGGHFRALVVSDRFEGLSRVAAQRLVYASLEEELASWIHALALRTVPASQWPDGGGASDAGAG